MCKKGWITYQIKYLSKRIAEVIIYKKKWETKHDNCVKPSWKIHCIFCRKVYVVRKKHSSTLIAIKVATKLVPYLFKPLFFKIAMKELEMCRCMKADVKWHWSSCQWCINVNLWQRVLKLNSRLCIPRTAQWNQNCEKSCKWLDKQTELFIMT